MRPFHTSWILYYPCTIVDLTHLLSTQGDQNAPGVIPLAIKDVFSMIQDVSVYLLNYEYSCRVLL